MEPHQATTADEDDEDEIGLMTTDEIKVEHHANKQQIRALLERNDALKKERNRRKRLYEERADMVMSG